MPWLKIQLADRRPVSCIKVLNDLRHSGDQADHRLSFMNIQAAVLDAQERLLWSSRVQSAPDQPEMMFQLPVHLLACASVVISRSVAPTDPPNRAYLCTSGVIVYGLASTFRPLTFLRHGESQHNVGVPWDPILGPTLTERGEQQARGVSLPVDVDIVFASPMRRALRTAHVVSESLGKRLHVQCRAHELGHAAWQELNPPVVEIVRADGLSIDQIFNEHYLETMRQKDARTLIESPAEMRERAHSVIQFLLLWPEFSVLLVAHGGMIQELLTVLAPEHGMTQIAHCQPICVAFPVGGVAQVPDQLEAQRLERP